ncbi:MAG: phospholipase [Planctomycetia bacterium]|nr:phospholipase [Planctomycetia bacterium]
MNDAARSRQLQPPKPRRDDGWEPILVPGRNCWIADAAVESSGLLVDGDDYYRAFYEAARQARRHILLAGWRFNSDVRLVRGKDAERGGDVFLVPFLHQLLRQNPDLHVYVLAWNFAYIYFLEWEWFQKWKFQHGTHKRLRFVFDSQHPIGASHHQKFAVVDGQVAFAGGLDFCCDDWDDRRHLAHNPARADSGWAEHSPYHDVQAWFAGKAAQELARYFQSRWQRAGGGKLELPQVPDRNQGHGHAAAIAPTIPIAARKIALSRNEQPVRTGDETIQQVSQLYQDAIALADELIYIENQYFSSHVVFQALKERMRAADRPRLDIVLVLPKELQSWSESIAMGPPRMTILDELRETAAATGHRFGAYYTVGAGDEAPAGEFPVHESPVHIHSKLLLVDDLFLTVGSANTSNRSLGLDSELNVAWEVDSHDDVELAASLRDARVDLLTEHCGLTPGADDQRKLAMRRGLVEHLDRLAASRSGRLRLLTNDAIVGERGWLEALRHLGFSLDVLGAAKLDGTFYEKLAPRSRSRISRGMLWLRERLLRRKRKRNVRRLAKERAKAARPNRAGD